MGEDHILLRLKPLTVVACLHGGRARPRALQLMSMQPCASLNNNTDLLISADGSKVA